MKLVVDNTDTIPVELENPVPAQLRKLAEDIEAGHYGGVVSVYALIDAGDDFHGEVLGEELTCFEALGMLEFAKRAVFGDD